MRFLVSLAIKDLKTRCPCQWGRPATSASVGCCELGLSTSSELFRVETQPRAAGVPAAAG